LTRVLPPKGTIAGITPKVFGGRGQGFFTRFKGVFSSMSESRFFFSRRRDGPFFFSSLANRVFTGQPREVAPPPFSLHRQIFSWSQTSGGIFFSSRRSLSLSHCRTSYGTGLPPPPQKKSFFFPHQCQIFLNTPGKVQSSRSAFPLPSTWYPMFFFSREDLLRRRFL